MKSISFLAILCLMQLCYCQSKLENVKELKAKGKLFIIGGGKKSDKLVSELIALSNLNKENFMVILPMASEEPDSAVYYTAKQFIALGVNSKKIKALNFNGISQPKAQIDSLKKASLIYITGGDQNLFMKSVLNTPVYKAIHAAYQNGATIAGTSAGAAVMSTKMISGNELKHPTYTGEFHSIEAKNFELTTGLGLLPNAIIDQHFIYQMRMNRLLSVAMENPDYLGIGIDESTAIVVQGDDARVTGDSQVVIIRKTNKTNIQVKNGLLGSKDIRLEILLPGEKFKL
ncbi:cyanophycinase [Flavobacterium sp.]|uniref:cyanophycinase n=1 Tax=Flavobacterium sp. TaxID=239 RepID=UPI0031CF4A07